MLHLDEYRDPALCRRLVDRIRSTARRSHTIMEVCGGQTHGLLRNGIDQELSDEVELIHGPGCPVCVTPGEDIDRAVELCRHPGVLLTTFGDMLRVPGSRETLRDARAAGGNVQMVYSPIDAVQLAQKQPDQEVVFFAVGFETTAPATAIAIQQAAQLGLSNFSVLVAHVRVLPAMEAVMLDPTHRVEAFLAAGHVCAVDGYRSYEAFVERFRVPVVITGFEPVDLLAGILACVEQLENAQAGVANVYQRNVCESGNARAQEIVQQVYEVTDRPWRGLGTIKGGGLRLREDWQAYDARERFAGVSTAGTFSDGESAAHQALAQRCRSGEVLMGHLRPTDCEYFGRECTPDRPLGAPMVSAEGACMAYYLRGDGSMRKAT